MIVIVMELSGLLILFLAFLHVFPRSLLPLPVR